jgi:hypothetical protein
MMTGPPLFPDLLAGVPPSDHLLAALSLLLKPPFSKLTCRCRCLGTKRMTAGERRIAACMHLQRPPKSDAKAASCL